MRRAAVVSILLLALMLTACSRRTPTTTAPVVASPTVETAAGGVGLGAPTATPADSNAPTYTVERGTIEDIYSFTARLTPIQYTVTAQQNGVIQKILAAPGQAVGEGDVIVQLDTADLEAQLEEARLSTAQAQRLIDQAAQAAQLEVQQAQITLEAAQKDLEQAKEPPTAVAIVEAQTAVRAAQASLDTVRNNASQSKNQAKAALDKAVIELQDIQERYGEAVTQLQKAKGEAAEKLEDEVKDLEAQMRDAEAAVNTAVINYDTARNNEVAAVQDAEAQLDLARARLDDLQKGPDKFVIAEKERAVRSAQLVVAQARQKAAADPTLLKSVESGQLLIAQLEEEIATRQVVAPISGTVIELIARPGDPLQIGSPVLLMGDESRTELVARSSDMLTAGRTVIPALTIGQPVELSFSRYPGTTFSGTISQLAASDIADISNLYHFTFDAQGKSFAPGDQAEITIVLQRKEGVLFLPPQAVDVSQFSSSVILRANGEDTDVDVQVGLVTADKVEILGGLNEGDVVVGQ